MRIINRSPRVGDIILCNGQHAEVTEIHDFSSGDHPDSPIQDYLPARRWTTAEGTRWSGLGPGGVPHVTPLVYEPSTEETQP